MTENTKTISAWVIVKESYKYSLKSLWSYMWWSLPLLAISILMAILTNALYLEITTFARLNFLGFKNIMDSQFLYTIFFAMKYFIFYIIFGVVFISIFLNVVLLEKKKKWSLGYYRNKYFLKYTIASILFQILFFLIGVSTYMILSHGLKNENVAGIASLITVFISIYLIFLPPIYSISDNFSAFKKNIAILSGNFGKIYGVFFLFIIPINIFAIIISPIMISLFDFFSLKGFPLYFRGIEIILIFKIFIISYSVAIFTAFLYRAIASHGAEDWLTCTLTNEDVS